MQKRDLVVTENGKST